MDWHRCSVKPFGICSSHYNTDESVAMLVAAEVSVILVNIGRFMRLRQKAYEESLRFLVSGVPRILISVLIQTSQLFNFNGCLQTLEKSTNSLKKLVVFTFPFTVVHGGEPIGLEPISSFLNVNCYFCHFFH